MSDTRGGVGRGNPPTAEEMAYVSNLMKQTLKPESQANFERATGFPVGTQSGGGADQSGAEEKCCDHCGKAGAKARCARCKSAVYCGRTCQRSAWRKHRPACRFRAAERAVDESDARREAMWKGMRSTAAERAELAKLLSATDEAGAPLRAKILAEFEKRGISTRADMIPQMLAHMNADESPQDISGWVDEKVAALRAKADTAEPAAPEAAAAEEQKPSVPPKKEAEGLLEVTGKGLQKEVGGTN